MQAAVGCEQLKRLPEIVDKRRELATRYQMLLASIPGLGLPREQEWARSNWQSFCVRLPQAIDQKQVMQSMLHAGVATRRGIMCSHREGAYPRDAWTCASRLQGRCDCTSEDCADLRHSEASQDRCIVLPLFPQMTAAEQQQVTDALKRALGR
jgi:dTDP-4-amino-4,6-dideoxygalactose transaminase